MCVGLIIVVEARRSEFLDMHISECSWFTGVISSEFPNDVRRLGENCYQA